MNLWKNKQLRSIFDPNTQGYWFSVIDLCALLTDSSHKAARNYWKWLKEKQITEHNQVVSVTNHLKLQSPNGRYYFTEVVDFTNLVRLVMTCPSPNANVYRLWFTDMLLAGVAAAEIEKELVQPGLQHAAEVGEKFKQGYVRLEVKKETVI